MVKTMSEKSDCSHTYEQALDDFGITQLLSQLSHYADADFNAQLMNLEEQELDRLAALLIQRLTNSLNGRLIASYLNAIRHGDEEILVDPTHLTIPLPSPDFPHDVVPRYQENNRVRWRPLANTTDWGTVMGHFYAQHQCQWGICYLIRLDSDSPSAAWTVIDTAWEEDLELTEGGDTSSENHSCNYPLPGLPPTQPNDMATLKQLPLVLDKMRSPLALREAQSQTLYSTLTILPKSLRTTPGNYTGHGNTTTPRTLTQREQNLIALYSNCQLALTPKRFYAKWSVSYEQLAAICSRSTSTVRRWFTRGRYYRRPAPSDLRHLAMMDFLLEHFEEIPVRLLNTLCPSNNV